MRSVGLVALLLVACATETDQTALPLREAEQARGLAFIREPRVVRRTRASYAEEVASQVTEAEVTRYKTVWGRLGYVPTDFDLRAASRADTSRVGAFYVPTDGGQITTFDEYDDRAILVHELVHALQDQHFDLEALDAQAHTTDEALAERALVEGDARLAEVRYRIAAASADPLERGPQEITSERARAESDYFLSDETVPAFLSAYASFTYAWGSVVVAKAVGLHAQPPRWSTEGADALFTGAAPRTSEAVLRTALGLEIDPVVEVGLERLPGTLGERWDVREVDSLGAWLAWILLREAGDDAFDAAFDWDGDQLVVIGEKDPTRPPAGLVWTSAWETEARAQIVVDDLHRLHAAAAESMVIDRAGTVVVFAKGTLPIEDVHALANAALYARVDGPRPSATRPTLNLERFLSVRRRGRDRAGVFR